MRPGFIYNTRFQQQIIPLVIRAQQRLAQYYVIILQSLGFQGETSWQGCMQLYSETIDLYDQKDQVSQRYFSFAIYFLLYLRKRVYCMCPLGTISIQRSSSTSDGRFTGETVDSLWSFRKADGMKFIPAVFTGHKIDKPSLQHDFLILILVVKDIIIFLIAVGAFI